MDESDNLVIVSHLYMMNTYLNNFAAAGYLNVK